MRFVVILVLALALGGYVAWTYLGAETASVADEGRTAGASDATEKEASTALPAVTVVAATMATVEANVPVVGSLVARQQVEVSAMVSGHEVIEILAEAGDSVTKGQVLARLESDTLRAQLAQAKAEFAQAIATQKQTAAALERASSLRSSRTASQAALDDAVAADANAQATVERAAALQQIAELNLERAQIRAPAAGRIVDRNAVLGAIAGSAPLFTIIADGEIEFAAEVIETALPLLSEGAAVEVDVSGLGQVKGTVRLLPATVDPVTRLGQMRIALEAADGLRTGLFASGSIIVAQREALTVSANAVLSDNEGTRVQRVENGVVHSQPVKAGLLWQGKREIISGLEVNDTVIADAGAFFADGDRVRAIEQDNAAQQAAPDEEAAQR